MKSSSRPETVASNKTRSASPGRPPKRPAGPMIGPKPDPTLASKNIEAGIAET